MLPQNQCVFGLLVSVLIPPFVLIMAGTSIINISNREQEHSSNDAGSQNPARPCKELGVGEEGLRFSSASLCGSVSGRVIGRPCLSGVRASAITCSRGLCVAHRVHGQYLLN